jgi:hypothetical protein
VGYQVEVQQEMRCIDETVNDVGGMIVVCRKAAGDSAAGTEIQNKRQT